MVEFFNHPFFIIVGGITVIVSMVGILYGIITWVLGITPVVFRLGIALRKRKVAIFASNDSYNSLRNTLLDSKIFNANNIIPITDDNIDKAKDETIFLVDWKTFSSKIETVFSARRNHQTTIVIYAEPASIPQEIMKDIANRANTVVVNFRGRLLNDILTSLITTSYDSK